MGHAGFLLQGQSDRQVAEQLHVVRETVCRWRNDNPFFAAVLNRLRKELWDEAHDKLRGLVGKAADVLDHALDQDDAKVALEVLKTLGVCGRVGAPTGATDPELVLLRQAAVWAGQELQRQGVPEDPLADLLMVDGPRARLTRQRLEELRSEYLT